MVRFLIVDHVDGLDLQVFFRAYRRVQLIQSVYDVGERSEDL